MTKRTLGILSSTIAAMGVLVGSAAALEVASSTTVAGTPDSVWKKIGDFCAIQTWHPGVSKCEQTDEAGATYRTLTATDGGTIKEKLVEQTDTSYTYEIIESPLPVEDYQATISVSAEGDRTRVDWKGSFDAKGQSDAEAKTVISDIYKAGLEQIAKMGGN
ncbi:SRPBCC family protein [Pseudaminobacter arsenicus]|uniref:SRPBCC family protein n=1 Tax=Borborobacter arsenicus TaxID=1851146 RepID=A0A432V856_9HYPH|nr:SRPBCC family protein [Pseudaminobacter arsenicus]RUM98243.1 SRPBCC family protein [Pseudaminobacter arsenicus]